MTLHPRRGFTLVELLVAIGLLTIVVGLLLVPFLAARALLERGSAQSDAQAAARETMETLQRELSNAMYVFDQPPADDALLAFLLPAVDNFGRLIQPVHPALDTAGRLTAIRYWGVLRDPTAQYNPFYGTIRGARNPVLLARTEIANTAYTPLFPSGVLSAAVDRSYPAFDADWTNLVIGLLHTGDTFNLPQEPIPPPGSPRGFQPAVFPRLLPFLTNPDFSFARVTDEVARPREVGGAPDFSTLEGTRGLWTGDILVAVFRSGASVPFVTGRMEDFTGSGYIRLILRDANGDFLYDTAAFPQRDLFAAPYAFGVDYIRGRLLFGFSREEAHPTPFAEAGLRRLTLGVAALPDVQIVEGSTFVQVVDVDNEVAYFTRTSRLPPGPGQYAVQGADLIFAADDPVFLDFFDPQVIVRYQYRNNRDTDRVHISYTTKEDITATLIVSRQSGDSGGRQEFSMTRRIAVRNARR